MASEKYLSTQTAIVLAGAMIAAGLFFGLRDRGSAPPPAGTSAPVVTAVSPPEPTSPAPPPPATAPPATPPEAPASTAAASAGAQAAATTAAQKALDAHRAEIIEKCLKPSVAKNPAPPKVFYTFNYVFDPTGKEIGRGVEEHREGFRADVALCINAKLPAIQIPPPGALVRVTAEWTFP